MRQLFAIAFLCASGAAVVGACSSSSKSTGSADAGGTDTGSTAADTGGSSEASTEAGGMCAAVGSGATQYTTGNATCDACLAANCCTSVTTCVGNTPCLDALNCTVACVKADGGSTDSCGIMCIGENDGSGTDAFALSGCEMQSCASSC
jgi:hypothetical protein